VDGERVLTPPEQWAADLQRWGLPAHILAHAPESPWTHPIESFRPTDTFADTPSRRRAVEALVDISTSAGSKGWVLDVGCGGGRASFPLAKLAGGIVGVDQQPGMVAMFEEEAHARGIDAQGVLGSWPEIAPAVPSCDVVICHHVVFNVSELVPFAEALTEHARHRVVVELSMQHPLANLSEAWKRFWDLERPTRPTALDAAAVLADMGLAITVDEFEVDDPKAGNRPVTDRDVQHTRVRLCLTADRDPDVRSFLENLRRPPRRYATISWRP
jgi:SAM-dependent methyltransferase